MTLIVESVPVGVRIRDAALVCVGRFGLAKTTVDDIAREAGCSRATLYRYFDGRPAILRATVVAEFDRVSDALLEAGRAEPTFADAVVAVVVRGARASCARTMRCSSCSSTNPTRCSATSPSGPATACSSRSVTQSHRRSTVGCRPTGARGPATGSPASSVRTPSCRIRPSTSPTPLPLAVFSPPSSFPDSLKAGTDDFSRLLEPRRHHRPRRHQRLRRDPRRHQHRRQRGAARDPCRRRRRLHVELRTQPSRTGEALREGEDVAVERQRPPVGHRGRSGRGRPQQPEPERHRPEDGPRRHAVREVGRQGVAAVRHRVAELDALAVHAW